MTKEAQENLVSRNQILIAENEDLKQRLKKCQSEQKLYLVTEWHYDDDGELKVKESYATEDEVGGY